MLLSHLLILAAVRGTAMETFGMRRSQSLRGLSGVQERSWVMPAPTRWDRKSVPELVQQYVLTMYMCTYSIK